MFLFYCLVYQNKPSNIGIQRKYAEIRLLITDYSRPKSPLIKNFDNRLSAWADLWNIVAKFRHGKPQRQRERWVAKEVSAVADVSARRAALRPSWRKQTKQCDKTGDGRRQNDSINAELRFESDFIPPSHLYRLSIYKVCLAWYNVVLTARSLKREIQTTAAKC